MRCFSCGDEVTRVIDTRVSGEHSLSMEFFRVLQRAPPALPVVVRVGDAAPSTYNETSNARTEQTNQHERQYIWESNRK